MLKLDAGLVPALLDVLKALLGAGFSSFTCLHSALLSQESCHLLALVYSGVLGTVRLFHVKLQMAMYQKQAHIKKDMFLILLGNTVPQKAP